MWPIRAFCAFILIIVSVPFQMGVIFVGYPYKWLVAAADWLMEG